MTLKKIIYAAIHFFSVIRDTLKILDSKQIRKEYNLTTLKKIRLGTKMFLNTLHIPTGTNFKVHLSMALKLFEMDPNVNGHVLECGAWKGGSTANLSLVCKIVNRKLLVYDSFEGLPKASPGDRQAVGYQQGDYLGTLTEVKENIQKFGAIEVCEFVQGWYSETLPGLKESIALAFTDVDIEASLDTCIKYIWPQLIQNGYIFTDEATGVNYVALFYSEKWWKKHFNTTPPGIIGSGTGLPLGNIYIGPYDDNFSKHKQQEPGSGAYTYKGLDGLWTYYPEEFKQ